MSQSFRCHVDIAKRIEAFSKKYIDKNAEFKGVEYDNLEPETSLYVSRNNAALIGKMIEFNANNTKYNLLRKADSIFELVLILLNTNSEKTRITKGEFKYLQNDIDYWKNNSNINFSYKTPLSYIRKLYGEDKGFKSAFSLIGEHGPGQIFAAYNDAKLHEKDKVKHAITIGTAFGTKGSESDKVTILDDLNNSISDIIKKNPYGPYSDEELVEFNLYYVAASRSKYILNNAIHLPTII